MSKKLFFDIYSWDTFNRANWWYMDDRPKEYEWPPYLTAPLHYQRIGEQTSWRKVIDSKLKMDLQSELCTLSCLHHIEIPMTYFHEQQYAKFREVWVNCKKCGGTGEIRTR